MVEDENLYSGTENATSRFTAVTGMFATVRSSAARTASRLRGPVRMGTRSLGIFLFYLLAAETTGAEWVQISGEVRPGDGVEPVTGQVFGSCLSDAELAPPFAELAVLDRGRFFELCGSEYVSVVAKGWGRNLCLTEPYFPAAQLQREIRNVRQRAVWERGRFRVDGECARRLSSRAFDRIEMRGRQDGERERRLVVRAARKLISRQ